MKFLPGKEFLPGWEPLYYIIHAQHTDITRNNAVTSVCSGLRTTTSCGDILQSNVDSIHEIRFAAFYQRPFPKMPLRLLVNLIQIARQPLHHCQRLAPWWNKTSLWDSLVILFTMLLMVCQVACSYNTVVKYQKLTWWSRFNYLAKTMKYGIAWSEILNCCFMV